MITEHAQDECLFIGGSVDGQWLKVDSSKAEQRISSLSGQPALQDPVARELDNDPIPDETVVYEIYQRIEVDGADGVVLVYVLNALGENAIDVQLAKYFGGDGED